MHPDFELPGQQGFQIFPSLPDEYRGSILRGAEVITARSEAGIIICQSIIQPHYVIKYSIFQFLKSIRISAHQDKAILVSILALKNNLRFSIKGIGLINLRQGQFALLNTQDRATALTFDKDKEYQSIEISWSQAIINQALPLFPFLQAFLSVKNSTRSVYLPPPARTAGPKALDLVQDLLMAPYNDHVSRLYFEHKVREYLLLLLVEAGKKQPSNLNLTKEQREIILELGRRLSSQPDKRFPISELAVETRMNEMKLKMAFKETFGQGIFEYQLAARMNEAQRLLKETDLSNKAIAGMVGYRLTTSFITKFREYFGYPPSSVTRNKA